MRELDISPAEGGYLLRIEINNDDLSRRRDQVSTLGGHSLLPLSGRRNSTTEYGR